MKALLLWCLSRVVPTGAGLEWYAAAAPNGAWALQDGSAISRTTYASLFAVLGTTWGSGDGSTTFNLPDQRGRVAVTYAASGGHADVSTLGNNEGSTLANRRPKHPHTVTDAGHTHHIGTTVSDGGSGAGRSYLQPDGGTGTSSNSGTTGITIGLSGTANDAAAYVVVNKIVRL